MAGGGAERVGSARSMPLRFHAKDGRTAKDVVRKSLWCEFIRRPSVFRVWELKGNASRQRREDFTREIPQGG